MTLDTVVAAVLGLAFVWAFYTARAYRDRGHS